MIRVLLVAILAVAAIAETGDRFPTCGDAKGAPCKCLRRSYAIQEKAMSDCLRDGGSTETCLVMQPEHCALIEHDYEGSEDSGYAVNTDERMSNHCQQVCKRGDCRCNDGAVCHVDHKAADHAGKKKLK